MSYTLRTDPDSLIRPIIRNKNYTIMCKCGGVIDVKRMMSLPISSSGSDKSGWLAICRQCRATSGVQETWSEAEGHVIGNALEKINAVRDGLKKLKERLEEKKNSKS